jgi:hypothetical protein
MSKKVLFNPSIFTLAFVALILSCQAAVYADTYFPLQVGNEWTYVTSGRIGADQKTVVKVACRYTEPFINRSWYGLYDYNGKFRWLRETRSGNVYEWGNLPWYRFNHPLNFPWTMYVNEGVQGTIPCSNGARLEIISRDEKLEVPAGTFSTLHIRFTTICQDAGITDEWFAPGVGLVKRVEQSFAGPRTMQLHRAVINGKVIEGNQPSPVSISVLTDKPEYWENHMPGPGPIPQFGPEISIYAIIDSINGQPQTLNFIDYNVWDIQVFDPDKKLVWTNPKMLAPAPIGGIDRIIPGREKSEFKLRFPWGSKPGVYTVVAKLLVSKNPPPDAITTFKYDWAY